MFCMYLVLIQHQIQTKSKSDMQAVNPGKETDAHM